MATRSIFYVADLHGSEPVLNKVINSAKFYHVDTIVVGGDITGKLLIPIVDIGGGRYSLELFGVPTTIEAKHLEETQKKIRGTGSYWTLVSRAEYDAMASNPAEVKRHFLAKMLEHLEAVYKKAEDRLRPNGVQLYIIPGNDDYVEVADFLRTRSSDVVINFEEQIVELGEYQLVGYGKSNPTPWHTPRETSDATLGRELRQLTSKADAARTILIAHAPPSNTTIDKAPKLTADMKPVTGGGHVEMVSVGSAEVRHVIEELEPIVALHGHIHESPGVDTVIGQHGKKVPVMNPGSQYSAGVLQGIIVQLSGGRVTGYNFTTG
ncbi:MAG TPA: metallophosphoesterase [Thermoplasmata archaeon]|nr:metallophosphoesterase [Thermoplasmata archaeon]